MTKIPFAVGQHPVPRNKPYLIVVQNELKDNLLTLVMAYKIHKEKSSFTHPNIVRSRPKTLEFKHSNQSGHKWWTQSPGLEYVFVVPYRAIQLILSDEYSYPKIEIGGCEITLNVSGGTMRPSGWFDQIDSVAYTLVDLPGNTLESVARNAVRVTPREPFTFYDETEEYRKGLS
jgi:hypothetical protein